VAPETRKSRPVPSLFQRPPRFNSHFLQPHVDYSNPHVGHGTSSDSGSDRLTPNTRDSTRFAHLLSNLEGCGRPLFWYCTPRLYSGFITRRPASPRPVRHLQLLEIPWRHSHSPQSSLPSMAVSHAVSLAATATTKAMTISLPGVLIRVFQRSAPCGQVHIHTVAPQHRSTVTDH
jgi:hypothetical protein